MNNYRKFLVFIGDTVAVYMAFLATLYISFPVSDFQNQFLLHLKPFTLLFLVWFVVLYIFNLYDTKNIRIYLSNIQTTLLAFLASGALGMVMFYLFPLFSIAPKTNLAINLVVFLGFFILWRRIISSIFSKNLLEKTLIIGEGKETEEIHTVLSSNNPFGYQSLGIYSSIDDAVKTIKREKVTHIILGKNLETIDVYKITRLGVLPISLVTVYERIYEKIPLSLITDEVAVSILNKEKDVLYSTSQRIIDILFSSFVIVATLPITLLASLLIYIEDRGDIFYTQTRVGKNNKIFTVYKFRSMRMHAEKDGAVWAGEKDTRITNIGKILRKTHIDEIPQMINILRGDIGLVGPRPERPEFVEKLENEIPFYFIRHTIKPGFTGWAQIKFRYARSKDDSSEKLEYDLFYLKHQSIALDIGIILKTIQIIFTH